MTLTVLCHLILSLRCHKPKAATSWHPVRIRTWVVGGRLQIESVMTTDAGSHPTLSPGAVPLTTDVNLPAELDQLRTEVSVQGIYCLKEGLSAQMLSHLIVQVLPSQVDHWTKEVAVLKVLLMAPLLSGSLHLMEDR